MNCIRSIDAGKRDTFDRVAWWRSTLVLVVTFSGVVAILAAGWTHAVRPLIAPDPAELHLLVTQGDVNGLRTWLSLGVDPESPDLCGNTLLITAVSHKQPKVAELLLQSGAQVRMQSSLGMTPLLAATACTQTCHDSVRLLLNYGADPNELSTSRRTPLMQMALHADYNTCVLLLNAGARVDTADENGQTPVWYAAAGGNADILRLLLAVGGRVHQTDDFGSTPLHDAAAYGTVETVEVLLRAGADANRVDRDGRRAIDLVVTNQNATIHGQLRELLERSEAKPNRSLPAEQAIAAQPQTQTPAALRDVTASLGLD